MDASKNRPVKTTRTSLELLEAIREHGGARISDLTETTGLARSTVHNHLQTLLDTGYVVRENNTYYVGLRLYHLGEHSRTRKEEYGLAEQAVERLANETEKEARFSVEERGRLINLFEEIGHASGSELQAGSYRYLHSTATGKAILAALPEERLDEIVETHGLPRQTEYTITDREALREELQTVRDHGYAIDDEEWMPGYKTVGTAIHYPDGRIFGGMAVGGPTDLLDRHRRKHERQRRAVGGTAYALDDDLEGSILSRLFETAEELEEKLADELSAL